MAIVFIRSGLNLRLNFLTCVARIYYQDVRAWFIAVSAQPASRHSDRLGCFFIIQKVELRFAVSYRTINELIVLVNFC